MTDLERRFAVFEGPVLEDGQAILTGRAPASSLDGYQTEVTVYTSGLGQLVCTLDGYGPCHNEEEVIEAAGYDPDADLKYIMSTYKDANPRHPENFSAGD